MAASDALGLVGTTVEAVVFDACVDSGGFGLVYRGRHTGLDEPVAIKCLRVAGLQTSDVELREAIAARFRDETKLLYRLSQGHLDIVRCIGSGTLVAPKTNEVTPYMILEWLEGQTLSAELRDRREDALPGRTLDEAIALLDSAASALAYAHAQGVVHRDIKPGNLFLTKTREGVRLKVLDFGLAKILSDESLGVRPSVETGAGVHFCSPSYGAPEQLTGQAGPVGPWTDIYSLTLVLLEVMKGEKVRPAGSLAEGLLKAIDPTAGSPTASSLGLRVPPAVEDLLTRAVAQKPLERPRDAGVFWSALKDAVKASMPAGSSGVPGARHDARPAPPGASLGATVADANVEAAMERVRQIQAARAAGGPGGGGAGATGRSPFAGTMLMQNAPPGAPHLAGPDIRVAPLPAHASPLASSLSPAHQPSQPPPPGKAPLTSPLAAPIPALIMPGAAAAGPAHARPGPAHARPAPPQAIPAPHAPRPIAQAPIAQAPIPQAPIPQAPIPEAPIPQAPMANPPTQPRQPAQAALQGPAGAPRIPVGPPGPRSVAPPPKSSGGGLAAVFVFVAIVAVGGAAIWWFLFRHHP